MAHNSSEINLSPVEREFRDLVQHGDDFFRIELLRHARSWYKKALQMNLETETVNEKIAACNKLLAFERKVIWIVLAIAVALIVAFNFIV